METSWYSLWPIPYRIVLEQSAFLIEMPPSNLLIVAQESVMIEMALHPSPPASYKNELTASLPPSFEEIPPFLGDQVTSPYSTVSFGIS